MYCSIQPTSPHTDHDRFDNSLVSVECSFLAAYLRALCIVVSSLLNRSFNRSLPDGVPCAHVPNKGSNGMGARNSSAFGISMEEPKTLKGVIKKISNKKKIETHLSDLQRHACPTPTCHLTRIFHDDPIWLVLPSFFFRLLFSIDH